MLLGFLHLLHHLLHDLPHLSATYLPTYFASQIRTLRKYSSMFSLRLCGFLVRSEEMQAHCKTKQKSDSKLPKDANVSVLVCHYTQNRWLVQTVPYRHHWTAGTSSYTQKRVSDAD